jgi:hypothetical protein
MFKPFPQTHIFLLRFQILAFYTSQERVTNRTVNLDSLEAIEKELKLFDTNSVKLKNFDDRTR